MTDQGNASPRLTKSFHRDSRSTGMTSGRGAETIANANPRRQRAKRRLAKLELQMQFNRVANRLDARHFEIVVEMLKTNLYFEELRRTERAIWLRQPGANVDLQFSRGSTAKRDADKVRSQVSFLSETLKSDLEALASWAREHGPAAQVGSYSDREFYLDAPDAFVDFVIDAMRPELADYDSPDLAGSRASAARRGPA